MHVSVGCVKVFPRTPTGWRNIIAPGTIAIEAYHIAGPIFRARNSEETFSSAHRALPDLVVESAPRLIARTLRAAIVAAFVFRLSDIDNHSFEPTTLLVLGIEKMNDTLTICIFLDTV